MSRHTRSYIATSRAVCSSLGFFEGCAVTSSDCVTTPKVVLKFFYSAPYVATADAPCCNIETSIKLVRLLMVSCTLTKYISSPVGIIRPL
ncbi:hypothetical protein J1N35_041309, partial [Gossypium stocksii]